MWDDVAKAALGLLAALITLITPYAVMLVQKHVKAQDLYRLQHYASLAVQAVEQVDSHEGLHPDRKYDLAANFLQRIAGKAGIKLSDEDLRPLIESAVHGLNQFQVAVIPGEQPALTVAVDAPAVPAAPSSPPAVNEAMLQPYLDKVSADVMADVFRRLRVALGTLE